MHLCLKDKAILYVYHNSNTQKIILSIYDILSWVFDVIMTSRHQTVQILSYVAIYRLSSTVMARNGWVGVYWYAENNLEFYIPAIRMQSSWPMNRRIFYAVVPKMLRKIQCLINSLWSIVSMGVVIGSENGLSRHRMHYNLFFYVSADLLLVPQIYICEPG